MNQLKTPLKGTDKLDFQVEEDTYQTGTQFLLGKEIKNVAGIPLDARLYMQNSEPWADNLIENDEEVDLARPGLEYFFVEKNFEINVNGEQLRWHQRYITGEQVRKLAKLDKNLELFLKTKDARIDRLIHDSDKVDLLEPGIEQFFTAAIDHTITLIISGVAKTWEKSKISFKEVIILAFGSYDERPTMVYTIGYEDGPKQNPEGSMVKGAEVFTKNKMIFHATATDKS